MKLKARILIATGLVAASLTAAAPAYALGTPVLDASALAKIRETIAVGTKQLGAIQQQVAQVQQMRNTIGQVGPGSLGKILSASGLNFDGAQGALRDVGSMTGQMNAVTSQAKNLKISGESMNFANITNLSSGREAASQLFYYNGSEAMTSDTVGKLRERRNAMLRESAINGYGAAASMKGDMVKTQDVATKLTAQVQASADLRGDVQANTATMLAIYSEITKQTAIQAQMLEVQSAQTLAVDSTGKRGS
jgi:hypothetical protein